MGGGFYAGGRRGVKERARAFPGTVASPSFRLDAGLRHYAVALGDLVVHELTELLGGRASRDGSLVAQRGLHLAGAEGGAHPVAQPVDDLLRSALRHGDADPSVELV